MTEIAPYQPAADVATIDVQDRAVRRLTEWAQSAQAAHSIATTLVQTTFVPESFRNKPGEATAAILAGLEVGLQPMAALRSFDVIQGQAAPRAITLRAIVQSFGHEMVLEESTATRCRMRGKRKGSSEWVNVAWTIDRAKDLGLTGKHNWKAQPQAMLVARATSELARLIAADAILGLGYSAEEVADGGPTEQRAATETLNPTPTTTRTMRRRTATPEPASEPEADTPASPADDVHDAEEVPDEPTITKRQQGKLFALFTQKGIPEHEQKSGIEAIVGHPIAHRTSLTGAEFDAVITRLESLPDAVTE